MLRWGAGWALLAWLALAGAAAAQPRLPTDQPVLLTADQVTYDQELGLVTATGKVEITQGERILMADSVSYNERDGKVAASGNVSLLEPTGEVVFADYVELTDEMRNGFIKSVRMLLADNSRFAAAAGERRDGNVTVLERAVYSPCELCPKDPTRPPLWQIRAVKVTHNQETKRVEYQDATLEAFGVPVLYTPYFRHADPTVKRESGILSPSVTNNNYFGPRLKLPYYWAIAPDRDATITPQYSLKEGLQLGAEYRQRTLSGEYRLQGSGTWVDERDNNGDKTGDQEFRGHFRADGRFRLDEQFRWGYNVFRSTDDTYLRRYNIQGGRANTLVSRAFLEGINGRQYMALNGYSFQGLRPDDDPGSTPLVLPMFDYSFQGQPGEHGGRFGLDANMLSLYRTDGTDVRRLSVTGSWHLPYYAPAGDVYTLTAQLRADGYWINEGVDGSNPQGAEESALTGRVLPLLALDWRYPWVRAEDNVRLLVEPIAALVLTPYGGNPSRIPNEDSQSFEFDDTNLFSLSRFPGLDRYDSGPRLNYGLKLGAYGNSGGYTEVLAGQSLRPKRDDTFAPGSGLIEPESDYVGRLTVAPSRFLNLTDRVRLDQESGSLRRHEVIASAGPEALRLSLSYALLDRALFTDELQDREAIGVGLTSRLTKYWWFTASHLRNIGNDGGSLRSFGGLRYTDECFDILLFVDRTFVVDRDIRPSTTIGVEFRLVNLN